MVVLTTESRIINAELVQEFVVRQKGGAKPYAIYAIYGQEDSRLIHAGEREQCEAKLNRILAKLDRSGYDRIELEL